MEKLGKIKSAKFGLGGYQGAMLGVHFSFTFDGCCGVACGNDTWDANTIECDKHCKWTEADRSKKHDEIMRYVSDLLSASKVSDFTELVGKPVSLMFDGDGLGSTLKSWRILTRVM